jgi:GNAT superfamily N-acetyltransferase
MAHDPTREARRARCPEDVLAWIPWYADGGLSARERGVVEAHAAQCGDCRSELDLVAGEPWAFEDIELPDRDRLFDEITARIEDEGRSERATVIPISRGRGLSVEDMGRIERWVLDPGSELEADADEMNGDRVGGEATSAGRDRADEALRFERPERRAGPAAPEHRGMNRAVSPLWAAAAAILLLVAGGLGGASLEQWRRADATDASIDPAAYQLASAPPETTAKASPMIDVVVSDSVSARQLWSTLRSLGVEIVSGPTNLGVYRLRLLPSAAEGRDPTTADAAAIAARLVAPDAPVAIFAEPVP